jgi:ribosomal protein S6
MRLNEDIIRFLTIRINSVDEKPSPLVNNKSDRYKSEVINTETTSPSNSET